MFKIFIKWQCCYVAAYVLCVCNAEHITDTQLNEEVEERIPDDDLERSKHVGLFLIKVF